MATRYNPFTKKLDLVSDVIEGSALPASGTNGDMFFNTTDSKLYIYYNSWIAVGTGSSVTTGFYQEDGASFILAEDGSHLLQEA